MGVHCTLYILNITKWWWIRKKVIGGGVEAFQVIFYYRVAFTIHHGTL